MKRLILLLVFLSVGFLCFGENLQKTKEGYYSYRTDSEDNWICSEDNNTVVIFSDKFYYKVYYHMYFSDDRRKSVEKLLQHIIEVYEDDGSYMTDILERDCVISPGALRDYFQFDEHIEIHINVIYQRTR